MFEARGAKTSSCGSYEQIPDARGAKEGFVRVVDESGDDYLYPANRFIVVELPREAERAFAATARKRSAT